MWWKGMSGDGRPTLVCRPNVAGRKVDSLCEERLHGVCVFLHVISCV